MKKLRIYFDSRKINRLLDILLAKGLLVIAERVDAVFSDEAPTGSFTKSP